MILDIYKDSFEYASKNVKNLLILGVFYLFGFLVIPIFFILGYNYRIVKIATEGMINGNDELPEFEDWTLMFVEGIKCFVVYVAYAIIPIIIFAGILFGCSQINNLSLLILGFIVGIIITLIFTLYSFLAISHMATNDGSMKSAFEIKEITNIAKSIGWGRCFTTYIGMLIIVFVITTVVVAVIVAILMLLGFATISAVPVMSVATATGVISSLIVNFVITFIVMPYLQIFQSRCQGLLYNIR
ncbi:DUF4013 domain-containing protein [uncultured Methanobrevibacter sp.]|uniref:DUF4013 domain-containing protein n=1 Tax=uncultured Methanobrevibacter sp. TaxID=253161 RepID=UPI00261CD12E|nr:DUF4013 domain-containing protein [uncultured Methanobrevibacter sp.]